jgi:tripartite-type tricarboxylate transporter receptor subunit TctC
MLPDLSVESPMTIPQRVKAAGGLPVRASMLAAMLALLGAQEAAAQKWPDKAVRIVTPFAPGGGTDVFARLLAQRFSEVFGQQFIVDNRPGAGSTTGTEFVARSPADGHTLLMTSASFTFNPGLYPKLRYDSLKDFAPVSQVVRVPHVVLVLPSLPVKNLQDLVRIAKAKPGEVFYASSGPGSALHLAGALFAIQTNTQLTHVPYKGGPAAATAVMSGEATVSFSTIETVLSLIQAKRLRPLAVSTRERTPALPDVPTVMEAGYKDYEVIGWFGLLAPGGTPPAVVDALSTEISRMMTTPAIRDRAAQEGATPVGNKPAEFERFLRSEIAKWTPIIQKTGIKVD